MWNNFRRWVSYNSTEIGFVTVFTLLFGGLLWCAIASTSLQARLINERFDTSYTARDIVFAGETIKEVLIGDKSRLDVELTRKEK